jgi:hypothetical protein
LKICADCEDDCSLGCLRRAVWQKFTDISVVNRAIIALKMEAASTSETSVNFHLTTRRNITEDSHLHTRCRENLKSRRCVHSVKAVTSIYNPLSEVDEIDLIRVSVLGVFR